MTYTKQSHCSHTLNEIKMLNKPGTLINWNQIIILLDKLCNLSVVLYNLEPKTINNKKLLINLSDNLDKLYTELINYEKLANAYFQKKEYVEKTLHKEKSE